MTRQVTLNLNELTVRDITTAEKLVGYPIAGLLDQMPGEVLAALIAVQVQKDDPEFTLEQALDFRIADLDVAKDVDPTNGAEPKRSRRSAPSTTSRRRK